MHEGIRPMWAALVALALTVTACGGTSTTGGATSASPAASLAKADIKVGVVISLTGVANVYGPTQKNGVELAAQRINDAGGANGAKLVLVIEDDQSTPDGGVTAFRKLVSQDRVAAILGPTLSGTAVAAHPVAQSAQTPTIAISNTGDGIVGKCAYGACDYIFRASLGESAAIPETVKTVKAKLNLKSVVLMYAQDDKFSSDGFAIFKKSLDAQGITIKKEIAFSKNDVDLSGAVTQALAENPDAIVDTSLAGPAINILKEVFKRKPGLPVIGGNGFNTPAIIASAGAAAEGAISGTAWFLGNTDPVNKDFVAAYKAKYNTDPDQFAAQSFSGLYILLDALKRTPTPNSVLHDKLRDQLELTTGVKTPLGEFSFTKDHDVSQKIYVVQIKGGQFTLIN
ncbi:MAG TPA: ABC transporter substrate-binding protein [Candidatus Limnocylindria bacterium]|nr:ABC transporter substrate-binding protein [Candidatus Limnocylindria bacterium]